MGSSDSTGELFTQAQLVRDSDLCGQEFVADIRAGWRRTGFFGTVGGRALVKAIAAGDASVEASLLSLWGVR